MNHKFRIFKISNLFCSAYAKIIRTTPPTYATTRRQQGREIRRATPQGASNKPSTSTIASSIARSPIDCNIMPLNNRVIGALIDRHQSWISSLLALTWRSSPRRIDCAFNFNGSIICCQRTPRRDMTSLYQAIIIGITIITPRSPFYRSVKLSNYAMSITTLAADNADDNTSIGL